MERELVTDTLTRTAFGRDVVTKAAAGDVRAFSQIVAEHHDDMVRVCFVICGDVEAAQDAAQTAWSHAWRRLRSLREPDRLRSWLISIAANEVRKSMRRERRGRVVELVVADVGSDDLDPSRRPAQADLATALRHLGPDDRELLALRHVAGFDATEIGRSIGMTPSGVRSRLARAAARLRTELGDD
jgi:RNA polymerase sigma-70 factor (ECF subfamily)